MGYLPHLRFPMDVMEPNAAGEPLQDLGKF